MILQVPTEYVGKHLCLQFINDFLEFEDTVFNNLALWRKNKQEDDNFQKLFKCHSL